MTQALILADISNELSHELTSIRSRLATLSGKDAYTEYVYEMLQEQEGDILDLQDIAKQLCNRYLEPGESSLLKLDSQFHSFYNSYLAYTQNKFAEQMPF